MSEVAWEDQKQINEFSKLNSRLTAREQHIKNLKTEKELIDDVTLELELVDEDEKLAYRIGDALVSLKQSEIMERLEEKQAKLDDEISSAQTDIDGDASRMDELKGSLYAKFGKAINLERD